MRSKYTVGYRLQQAQRMEATHPAKLGTAYRNWPRQVLRTATIPAKLAGVISPTQ